MKKSTTLAYVIIINFVLSFAVKTILYKYLIGIEINILLVGYFILKQLEENQKP